MGFYYTRTDKVVPICSIFKGHIGFVYIGTDTVKSDEFVMKLCIKIMKNSLQAHHTKIV
jgi:hypothetical protein